MWTLSKLIQTSKDSSERLGDIKLPQAPAVSSDVVTVESKRTYQSVEGFGGAFTESAVHSMSLVPGAREKILHAYFDTKEGLNYNLCRTHMNSCDFSLGNYTYVKDGDESLASFDISHEKEKMIPAILEAEKIRGEKLKLFISPWSPPGWMKDTGIMNHGGRLLEKYRAIWAKYYIKFIQAYEKAGVEIWGLTIQNEPAAKQTWDSCIYTAEEEGVFIAEFLGPELERANLSRVKVMIWDHNKDIIYDRAAGTLGVPGAAKYIWGIAFHWYSGDNFEELNKTWKAFPEKKLLFSEGCVEGGPKPGDWAVGERYAHDMIGDFNNGCTAFVDWNIVLDEKGGPNHVGNFCDSPVRLDTKTGEIHFQNSFYYIGHFSKHVLPGAVKIDCQSSRQEIESTAFCNSDGSAVLITLNRTEEAQNFTVKLDGVSSCGKYSGTKYADKNIQEVIWNMELN